MAGFRVLGTLGSSGYPAVAIGLDAKRDSRVSGFLVSEFVRLDLGFRV